MIKADNNISIGKRGIVSTYVVAMLFVAISLTGIFFNNYLIAAFPFALAAILLAFYSLKDLMLLIVFLTPMSVPLSYFIPNIAADLAMPTEPLLILATGLFYLKMLIEKKFDKKILTHPITISILIYLGWMLVTTCSSTMPVVSLKMFLSKIWFITSFYLIATQIFRDKKNFSKYVWAYILGASIIVLITLSFHAQYGFAHEQAHWVMNPFYRDHTSYGAALAMLLPLLLGMMTLTLNDYSKRFIYWIFVTILSVGTIFSYTRAAWLSLAGALGVWLIVKLKIKLRLLIIGAITILVIALPIYNDVVHKMQKNDEVSSTDFESHVKSMSNISTDASNLERLNRWSCAWRMFKEKPIFGWGPGTYMFQYAPYQLSNERTIISTNAGDLGNAHSEYLGPLTESGVFGVLTILGFMITTLVYAFRVYKNSDDAWVRTFSLYSVLALITYYLHGFLNNFLDTDKITSLFWGYTAMIVALDVYHSNKKEKEEGVH